MSNSYLFFIIGGPLEQSDLQSKDSFIIDNGAFGLWVWVGKKASSAERTEAMRNAQGFIKKKGNHLCSTLIFSSWTSQKNIGWVVVLWHNEKNVNSGLSFSAWCLLASERLLAHLHLQKNVLTL